MPVWKSNFGRPTPSTRRSSHSSDIGQIIEDARDFENKHGRDHSNGWLLNHPLRKLLFYQHYLDTKARLAPAAKATTPTKKAKKAKKKPGVACDKFEDDAFSQAAAARADVGGGAALLRLAPDRYAAAVADIAAQAAR